MMEEETYPYLLTFIEALGLLLGINSKFMWDKLSLPLVQQVLQFFLFYTLVH